MLAFDWQKATGLFPWSGTIAVTQHQLCYHYCQRYPFLNLRGKGCYATFMPSLLLVLKYGH